MVSGAKIVSIKGDSIPACLRHIADLMEADGGPCLIGLWNTDFESEGISVQAVFDNG